MGLLDGILRRKPRKYGGIIGYLGLSDWWSHLLKEEQDFLRECFTKGMSVGGPMNPRVLDMGDASTSQTPGGFLNTLGQWAIAAHKYALAEKCLREALRLGLDVIDRHFTYLHLIDMCYKQRDKGPEWLERCAEYCRQDIDLFPAFKEAWVNEERRRLLEMAKSPFNAAAERNRYLAEVKKEIPFDLAIPSFTRLAIVYEKQGRFDDAMRVCELAASYGLHDDGTKGGFAGRRQKIERKASAHRRDVDGCQEKA